jgi:hypothetical protein
MRKTALFKMLLISTLLIVGLQACNLPMGESDDLSAEERVQTAIVQTRAAMGQTGGDQQGGEGGESANNTNPQTENQAGPSETTIPSPTLTMTLTPTIPLTSTMTLTPTLGKPMVTVSVDTNCRTGPGKIYPYIGALLVGEEAEVVGESMDGQYWIIKNPDIAGECWLWANYATVTGPTAGLPKYTPPPTPTPAFFWDGTWTIYIGGIGGPFITIPMTVSVSGKNVTGSLTVAGDTVTLSGTISDDYMSVSGTWSNPPASGPFEWFALGTDQFQGNFYEDPTTDAWCGSRGGAGQPVPCYLP